MRRFENKVVLVTGGTAGIGRATVAAFLAEGAKVAFTDIDERGLAQADAYIQAGQQALFIQADATKNADAERVLQTIVAKFGRLDIAINNVGGQGRADESQVLFHTSSPEGWAQTQTLTQDSVHLYMRYELAQMVAQGGGVIANTAYGAGLKALPRVNTAAYGAAKAAIISLTKYTAVQYAGQNIRVNAVAPGMVGTELVKKHLTPEMQQHILDSIQPNGRIIEPEEIAEAFLYLCSDAARSITGIVLPVDGGATAS